VPAAPEPQPDLCARADRAAPDRRARAWSASSGSAMGLVEDRGHRRPRRPDRARSRSPARCMLQTVPEGNPNYDNCRENAARLQDAGNRRRSRCRTFPTRRSKGRPSPAAT
jgi:hypothetical protein